MHSVCKPKSKSVRIVLFPYYQNHQVFVVFLLKCVRHGFTLIGGGCYCPCCGA